MDSTEQSSTDQFLQKVVLEPVENLLLDPHNPRLASGARDLESDQFSLLKRLWTEMSVDELVLSIAANGFFPEEPLFVVPANLPQSPEKYFVVEGNRRLAAVMILRDQELRNKLKIVNMPTLGSLALEQLDLLPVSKYGNRESLWAFLSFRHINSPQEWDAYSKAKFVALVHDEYGITLDEISRRIGDQHETVKRLYRGYKVLSQAEHDGVYDVSERYRDQFYFSHWYTALAYPQFQTFLGITSDDFEKEKPIPQTHLNRLGELLTWIYGRKTNGSDIKPVVRRQNPDLNYLREIIVDEPALDALRSGYTIERSHEISIGDTKRFRESLSRAKDELQRSKATVTTGYKGESKLISILEDIKRIADSLEIEMKNIQSSNRD